MPELEGWLHLKDGYKKSWKKVFFILRASGLYYSTKGKQKVLNIHSLISPSLSAPLPSFLTDLSIPSQGAKFLQLLVQFDEYELYHGINFKKTLKAPTQFCFALRVSRQHMQKNVHMYHLPA